MILTKVPDSRATAKITKKTRKIAKRREKSSGTRSSAVNWKKEILIGNTLKTPEQYLISLYSKKKYSYEELKEKIDRACHFTLRPYAVRSKIQSLIREKKISRLK